MPITPTDKFDPMTPEEEVQVAKDYLELVEFERTFKDWRPIELTTEVPMLQILPQILVGDKCILDDVEYHCVDTFRMVNSEKDEENEKAPE